MDELHDEIRQTARRLVSQICLRNHEAAQRLGLNSTDAWIIALLAVHGPQTAGRLATLTGFTTGSVTGIIDRLEQAGFVARTRDSRDRRKVVVARVTKGTARLAAEYQDQIELLDTTLRRRSAAELTIIADFLALSVPA